MSVPQKLKIAKAFATLSGKTEDVSNHLSECVIDGPIVSSDVTQISNGTKPTDDCRSVYLAAIEENNGSAINTSCAILYNLNCRAHNYEIMIQRTDGDYTPSLPFITIGSSIECDYRIKRQGISRMHLMIVPVISNNGKWLIVYDPSSLSGTTFNDFKVESITKARNIAFYSLKNEMSISVDIVGVTYNFKIQCMEISPRASKNCTICWDAERAIRFTPCMHYVTCIECSDKITECPLCRTQITSKNLLTWNSTGETYEIPH
jgi:hypothetical protein